MNKKALIALVVVVVAALGGGLYYRNYAAKNATPPVLQAVRTYQGLASKETGFLKADKSKTGSDFKQTKKDKDGKTDSKDKATLKFVGQAGGLSDVYSETDTNLDEITKNFKATAEGQEYMAGFYDVTDGKWKTTKQTYYGFDGINVITDTTGLAHTTVPAGNTFVFVSDKDSELYGYKDSSVEPTTSYDFCTKGQAGWNSGVVKKDELYQSVAHCMDSVTSVWVKAADYPMDAKFTKLYSDGGSQDALKAYKMSKFYMVWVNFSTDPTPVETKTEKPIADTGKLSVSNLKVTGHAVNADGTVSLDTALDLGFTWDATYNGGTIAQFTNKDKTGETLSYTWTIKDAAGHGLWALAQDYGKAGQGVNKDDAKCFVQLYDAAGKELSSGKDWTCNYTSLPGGIKLAADTKYTAEVTAFDGKDSVKTSVDFTTEKAAAPKDAGKLSVSGLQVIGGAVNADGSVSIDPAKGLGFRWGSTYNSDTIAQFINKDKTGETLSYTWTIKDAAGHGLWVLTQAYGKAGEGVNKDDAKCFVQLYDAAGKELSSGKDWTCNETSLPGGIVLKADTKYTVEVTAFDGKDSVKTSVDFTTEKAAAATSAISVKLSANTSKAQSVKQGATGVSFATFEITANEDVNVGSLVFGRKVDKNLPGENKENFLSAAVDLVVDTGTKDTQKLSLTFPSTLDVKKDLKKGEKLTVEVKADVAGNAYVDSTYVVSLEEVTFTGADKKAVTEKPALKGEMTTVILK